MKNLIVSIAIVSILTLSGCAALVGGLVGGAAVMAGADCWKLHAVCNKPELKLDTVTPACCKEKKECCNSNDPACCKLEKKLDPKTESALEK